MGANLKPWQRSELAILAKRAYRIALDQESRGAELDPRPSQLSEEGWRHYQVADASGKIGLRCCSQDDYAAVKAHFLDLLGESGEAFRWQVRASTEPHRQAWGVLERELAEAADVGIDREYLRVICRSKFKCELANAATKQLWSLIFDTRRSAAAKRRKFRALTKEIAYA